jgi:hypothetical protein
MDLSTVYCTSSCVTCYIGYYYYSLSIGMLGKDMICILNSVAVV